MDSLQINSYTEPTSSKQEPRLFAPFRALGLITNSVPFVLQTRSHKGATDGPRLHLLTCLGKAWAMWEGGKMGLLFVGKLPDLHSTWRSRRQGEELSHARNCAGPDAPHPIASMAMDGNAVWVSSGPYVIKYLRGKEVCSFNSLISEGFHSNECRLFV